MNIEASHLRISISKMGKTTVDLSFPAHCARWIMEMIPDDLLVKIRRKGIPLDAIQDRLFNMPVLSPCDLFHLEDIEEEKKIKVWLE